MLNGPDGPRPPGRPSISAPRAGGGADAPAAGAPVDTGGGRSRSLLRRRAGPGRRDRGWVDPEPVGTYEEAPTRAYAAFELPTAERAEVSDEEEGADDPDSEVPDDELPVDQSDEPDGPDDELDDAELADADDLDEAATDDADADAENGEDAEDGEDDPDDSDPDDPDPDDPDAELAGAVDDAYDPDASYEDDPDASDEDTAYADDAYDLDDPRARYVDDEEYEEYEDERDEPSVPYLRAAPRPPPYEPAWAGRSPAADDYDDYDDRDGGDGRYVGPPTPFRPSRPPGRAPRAVVLKQRRRRRRVIIGLTAFLSVTVTLVGSGFVYLQYRLGQIPRVDVPNLVGDQAGQVMNVLLVGSDSRERLEGADALQAGKGSVSGQRSDTIMVLHIDPRQEQAAILSIPRDLYVPIAGQGYDDRVNAAFALGGAAGLIETVQESLGITINHYVEVDFVGFKDIVDAVGGVELYLPYWVRDFTSGLDLHQVGCVEINGTQGLAWVRSRNLEILQPDGLTWTTDPRADLGRIERQQDFIRRMLKKALSSGLTNPLQLNRLLGIGVRDVTLDETLSTKDITALARRFNNLDADSVALFTLPTTPDEVDGASVLLLREEEAQPYLDRINGKGDAPLPGPVAPVTTTTTLPEESLLFPADVELLVLNGEGTPGAAARAAAELQEAGFVIDSTDDAPETRRTTIRHAPGSLAAAQLLDGALVGGADLIVDNTVTTTDLELVVGKDYQGLKTGPVAPVPRPAGTVTGDPGESGSTTTALATTTLPPTTLGPTTLPPGEAC